MTRGLPPGAAVRLRAGAFVPPAVASVVPLPVWLVFVGTVLLSVVLGGARWCRVRAAGNGAGIATPIGDSPDSGGRRRANAPSAGHGKAPDGQTAGGDAPWAGLHPDQRPPRPRVPSATDGLRDQVSRANACPRPPPRWRPGRAGPRRSTPSGRGSGRPGWAVRRRSPPSGRCRGRPAIRSSRTALNASPRRTTGDPRPGRPETRR